MGLSGGLASNGGGLPASVVSARSTPGAPTSGTWATSQAIVDSNGATWVCTAGGTPGTWAGVGSSVGTIQALGGVLADGTDESTKWNTALAAVNSAGGGIVDVPKGTYACMNVYLPSNVWLRFAPGVVFNFPAAAIAASNDAVIFRLHTSDRSLTTYVTNVGMLGTFVVDASNVTAADRTNMAASPRGMQLGNVQDFFIERAHGINIPGPAGAVIFANSLAGGARVCPNRGVIGPIVHEQSVAQGNSAIQHGAMRDVKVGPCWIDYGCAYRVEAHFSGTSTQGICENVTCEMASCDSPKAPALITAVASTGVFTATAHPFAVDDQIQLRDKNGGSGLGEGVGYYVNAVTTNTFTISATKGGSTLTWATDLLGGSARVVSRAAMLLAHDQTEIHGVKILKIRARNGADGLYTTHDSGAVISDCEIGGFDVSGGGQAVISGDGAQFDFSGLTIGPGRVTGSTGVGMAILPFATYLNPRVLNSGGSGARDLAQISGVNDWARIIGGYFKHNNAQAIEQRNMGNLGVTNVVTEDPNLAIGSNLLTANEADIETDATAYTAVGTATKAQSATLFHTGTKSLEVTVGSGGAGTVRTALAPSGKTVAAGQVIYMEGYCYAQAAAGRFGHFNVRFFDNANATIIDLATLNVPLTVGSWVKVSGYVTAPAGAVQMAFFPLIASASSGEKFNWDTLVMAIATGTVAPTQSYGINVSSGLTATVVGGNHSRNVVGPSTGAGMVATALADIAVSPKTVDSTGVSNGQGLIYDSVSGNWKPGSGAPAAHAASHQPGGSDEVYGRGLFDVADQLGVLTTNVDIVTCSTNATIGVAGIIVFMRVPVYPGMAVTNLYACVGVVGATLTANQCLMGYYDSTGVQRAISGDLSTTWTALGVKAAPVGTPYTILAGAKWGWVAMLWNGTTAPQFRRGALQSTDISGANVAAGGKLRSAFYTPTANTSLPASFTPTTALQIQQIMFWVGIA